MTCRYSHCECPERDGTYRVNTRRQGAAYLEYAEFQGNDNVLHVNMARCGQIQPKQIEADK
ncbi:hypothetical protein J6590_044582 [Homalodisca vitripennis]|nr:hypothetical protein J6590_044582 [Homalodisca vitripennis]